MKETTVLASPASDGIGDRLHRLAVPRQVERIDGGILGQGVDVEQPVVEIAAEAVDQDDGLGARSRAWRSAACRRRRRRTRISAPASSSSSSAAGVT